MSEFSFTEVDDKTNEILAAATNLHPEKPVIIQSKSLIPYFKTCGMSDEGIVPGGLQEYTAAILDIFSLPHTLENMKLVLDREDVRLTLKSAITAATKEYNASKESENAVDSAMPDMSKIQGISPELMRSLVKKAKEEEIHKEAREFSSESFTEFNTEKQTEIPEKTTTNSENITLEDGPAELPKAETHDTTLDKGLVFCPRCGWDLKVPYKKIELTEEDKIQFVYSIMHRMPFKKTYGLFDNKIKVTFRSKTVEDTEIILDQLRSEDDLKTFVNINHMQYYANIYELILLLDNIEGPATSPIQKIKPSFDTYRKAGKSLREYMEVVCRDYIGTEILFRLISEHFHTFQDTYNALVDEALKENFYNPA